MHDMREMRDMRDMRDFREERGLRGSNLHKPSKHHRDRSRETKMTFELLNDFVYLCIGMTSVIMDLCHVLIMGLVLQ